MRIGIRVDASAEMGLGHVKRSLALAHALRALGAEVAFVTRDHGIDTVSMFESEGFRAHLLSRGSPTSAPMGGPNEPSHVAWVGAPQLTDADDTCATLNQTAGGVDWIVVDHYGLDSEWHQRVASTLAAHICVIDDLADRPLRADLLVDHNIDRDHQAKYAGHGKAPRRILGGPRFALLGPAYIDAPACKVTPSVESIGIFMGGTDAPNASALALLACRDHACFTGPIEIASTSSNPHLNELADLCERSGPTRLLLDQPDLSAFFARHGLQIGAGGGASWERCRVGAPTIAMAFAINQEPVVRSLTACGVVCTPAAQTAAALGDEVTTLVRDLDRRQQLFENSRRLVDGMGARRVAVAMLAETTSLRPAVAADARSVYPWRNDSSTRKYFRNPSAVTAGEHLDWWSRALENPARRVLIAEVGGLPVGVYRLDMCAREAEVSIYVDPALQSLGLGSNMLRAGKQWAQLHEATVSRLVAEVQDGNRASASAFASAGFTRTEPSKWTWEIGA